ncbi:GNAT family N-acetyltransferase [Mesorhizobium sp. CU2]|uniref:GNAT family N-acetyltransferase n=1 Tax=unclassified Mesorhizobium TaxID=325217 RepID=UPI001126B50A|nr:MULTISPECIES: GNAT family N-acetyltransferase [unclassified Mesorhizobium]TPN89534.1 GNAT family N-acetyltransferase [Mesorhizobium sp. CU3]TPO12902.1 GNAT family N-acetyltransferase [Mesorhizobium sp. CU2]
MDQRVDIFITRIAPDFARWDELLALIMRAFASMDGVIDPPSSAHLLTAKTLSEKAKRETAFLAIENGRIIGCVFALGRARDFYVGKLAVDPERQRQGIGSRLMQAVERLAREGGKEAIELQTRIELTANHAAFARFGFRETERTAHEGYDRPTSITMRKVLT